MEAEREATEKQEVPAGMLRISVPTSYGHHRVLPLIAGFRQRYPAVQVDIHVSNRNIDFAEEGYDLAIRAREPADSTFVARKLEDAPLVVVTSPAYLKRAGVPASRLHPVFAAGQRESGAMAVPAGGEGCGGKHERWDLLL